MTRIENERKNAMKNMITTNITTTKKKIDDENRKRSRKKKLRNITNVELLKRIKKIIEKSKSETMKLK